MNKARVGRELRGASGTLGARVSSGRRDAARGSMRRALRAGLQHGSALATRRGCRRAGRGAGVGRGAGWVGALRGGGRGGRAGGRASRRRRNTLQWRERRLWHAGAVCHPRLHRLHRPILHLRLPILNCIIGLLSNAAPPPALDHHPVIIRRLLWHYLCST
jgi:hypothetical protein